MRLALNLELGPDMIIGGIHQTFFGGKLSQSPTKTIFVDKGKGELEILNMTPENVEVLRVCSAIGAIYDGLLARRAAEAASKGDEPPPAEPAPDTKA